MKNNNVLSLFSGAGGMDLGFESAGFNIKCAIELDKNAAETYKFNFNTPKVYNDDIKNISLDNLKQEIGKIDIIIGGPPCQGFSIAGKIGRNFLEDERNFLFKEYAKFVEFFKPAVFVMENVARLKTHNNGKTIDDIKKEFKNLGYLVKYEILNAENYGVPQKRSRIFIIGTLNKKEFKFPEKLKEIKTLYDSIGDLPSISSNSKEYENIQHISMNHTEQMLKKMKYVPEGQGREFIPEEIRPKSGDVRKYIRLDRNLPSYCITGDMRKVFHYEDNRALTIRELARIQTFPDSFIFKGNSISIQQQIGNAVPVLLSEKIAKSVKEFLNELS